jgi:hypothetical protein
MAIRTTLDDFWRKAKDAARRADQAKSPQSVLKRVTTRRPDPLPATKPLGPEASKALLKIVGPVKLTDKRREELAALAKAAQEAFDRPLSKNRTER